MPKGKGKLNSAEKGRKRKSGGKSDCEEGEDVIVKEDLVEMPDNESKQKRKSKTVKKLNFEKGKIKSPQAKRKRADQKESERMGNEESDQEVQFNGATAMAVFNKNGDEVIFEVTGGQENEFPDEETITEVHASNNNATVGVQAVESPEAGCSYGSTERNNYRDNAGDKETQKHNEEEEGMQCFLDYIRKQGLVIVEESRIANLAANKFPSKGSKHKGKDMNDNESVITIYKNTVHQSVITSGDGKKRESSSSDEPLDTSEELEQQFDEFNL